MGVGEAKSMKIKHTVSGKLARVQSSTFLRDLGPSCPKPMKGEEFIKRRFHPAK